MLQPSPAARRCLAALSLTVFSGVTAADHAAAVVTASSDARASESEVRLVRLVNDARTAAGLRPLAVHPGLAASARAWSASMAADPLAIGASEAEGCRVAHNPQLRTAVTARWRKLGENVGCGDVGADGIDRAFMASPVHRANILDPSFDSIGIGVVVNRDGFLFVTEQFMEQGSRSPHGPRRRRYDVTT